MLVVPFNHDQPDNAARVTRLGVARTISRKAYKADRVTKELRELLGNPSYANCARDAAYEIRTERGAASAVDLMLNTLDNKPTEVSSWELRTVA
jgi:UDP:flavonoid glycosyltransferase YjiC (YdhE family)